MNFNDHRSTCQPSQIPAHPQIEREVGIYPASHPSNERREFPIRLSFGAGVIERAGLADVPTQERAPQS